MVLLFELIVLVYYESRKWERDKLGRLIVEVNSENVGKKKPAAKIQHATWNDLWGLFPLLKENEKGSGNNRGSRKFLREQREGLKQSRISFGKKKKSYKSSTNLIDRILNDLTKNAKRTIKEVERRRGSEK